MIGFFPVPPPPKHEKIWGLYFAGSLATWLGIVIGLVIFGGIIYGSIVYEDINHYLDSRSSVNWSTAKGKIISSGYYRFEGQYVPSAHFSYEIEGNRYESHNLHFGVGSLRFDTAQEALDFLKPFGAFEEVQGYSDSEIEQWERKTFPQVYARRIIDVYYNPAFPSKAVIKRQFVMSPNIWGFGVIVIPVSLFLVALLVYSAWSWIKFFKMRKKGNELDG